MGWSGTPVSGKLNTQEVNEFVDRELREPGKVRIADRSGWTSQEGLHRFTLTELEPGYKPETTLRKIIVVTLVQQRDGMVYTKHMDESVGPRKTDCPLRILQQVEEQPPFNEQAGKWRANVREYHKHRLETTQLINELKAQYPNGNRAIIIDTYNGDFDPETRMAVTVQREAVFTQTQQHRRVVNTFRLPRDSGLYRLNPGQINIQATRELRARTQNGQEQEARSE